MNFLHSRFFQFVVLPLVVVAWMFFSDKSGGYDALLRFQIWAQALMVTGLAYLIAKSLLGTASSEKLYEQAIAGNVAAGLSYIGVCLLRAFVLLGLLLFFSTQMR